MLPTLRDSVVLRIANQHRPAEVDHSTIPVETEPGPLIQIASPRS